MGPAIVSGIVTGNPLVSYWPFFPQSLAKVPEVFPKVNPAKFRPYFLRGDVRMSESTISQKNPLG